MTEITTSEEGYSLIEVIVAFAILAGALLTGLEVFRGGLENLQRAERQLGAAQFARAEFIKLSLEPELQPGVRQGTADAWQWRAEVGTVVETGSATATSPLRVQVFVGQEDEPLLAEPIIDTILLSKRRAQ